MKFILSPLKANGHETPSWFIFYFLFVLPCLLAPQIKPSVVISHRFWLPWRLPHSPNPTETSAANLAERARWQLSYKCWLSPPGKCTELHSQSSRQYCRPWGPPVWAGTGRELLGCWELALLIHIIYSQLLSPQTNNKDNNHKGKKKRIRKKAFGVFLLCVLLCVFSLLNKGQHALFRFLISSYKHTQTQCEV